MLLCSKQWVRELNSSRITLLQSESYNCPQLSLVLLEFPLHCIPDYCFIIAYVWYPFHVCCHFSLMPCWLVQIKGYSITQRAHRKWKRMLQRFVVILPAGKVQLRSTVKMYSLPTSQIMTHVTHHMSHICWLLYMVRSGALSIRASEIVHPAWGDLRIVMHWCLKTRREILLTHIITADWGIRATACELLRCRLTSVTSNRKVGHQWMTSLL